MAQQFNIPITFRYMGTRLKWRSYKYDLPQRANGFSHPPFVFESVAIPAMTAPLLGRIGASDDWLIRLKTVGRFAGYDDPGILFSTSDIGFQACLEYVAELQLESREIPESFSELFIAFDRSKPQFHEMDPWEMRKEFMALEESNATLLAFLNKWGEWGAMTFLHVHSRPLSSAGRNFDQPLGEVPTVVVPFLVWRRRRELREGMLGSADSWLTDNATLSNTHRRPHFPFFGITDKACVQAIETTITLDHMRGIKSRICARPDCAKVFTVESNHGQIYCEQYCGHLVSLRKKRAAKKQANKTTKRKRS